MRSRNLLSISALSLCGCLIWSAAARSADDEARKQEEQAIRAAAKEYVRALAHNDTKALLDLWVPEGDIVDEFGRGSSAREVIERDANARAANATGEGSPSTVNVTESSIRLLTADVAIEDGGVEVSRGGLEPPTLRGRFTAIWLKRDGRWRLASLREARVPATTAADLAGLDWMEGEWTGQAGKARFDVSAHWNEKHTFLERDLKVTRDGKVILNGGQRIGVDPLDGQIKSWMHDAEGGHGEGVWTRHGDAWVVHAVGITPDGRRTSGTNVYTYDGKNQITWKSTGGFSNGQPVSDFEITLERAAAGKKE
ncbi:MAG: nuclear transport factor 2 family protein [Pirellulales bacterium]